MGTNAQSRPVMKKGVVIGCSIGGVLAIALCAGLGIFFFRWIFVFTQPVVDASDEFLGLLGQGKIAEAYAASSSRLRGQLDEASFTAAVKHVGLTDYSSVFWNNRKRMNQEGDVEGTVTTRNGGGARVALHLVE